MSRDFPRRRPGIPNPIKISRYEDPLTDTARQLAKKAAEYTRDLVAAYNEGKGRQGFENEQQVWYATQDPDQAQAPMFYGIVRSLDKNRWTVGRHFRQGSFRGDDYSLCLEMGTVLNRGNQILAAGEFGLRYSLPKFGFMRTTNLRQWFIGQILGGEIPRGLVGTFGDLRTKSVTTGFTSKTDLEDLNLEDLLK